jgi:hypothetical protein
MILSEIMVTQRADSGKHAMAADITKYMYIYVHLFLLLPFGA